jgi:putative ABC transport system substrate-binding protein
MMTTRRELLVAGILCALAAPNTSSAQDQRRIPRLGILLYPSPAVRKYLWDSFRDGLRDYGYVEGKSILIETVSAEGQQERLAPLAADLAKMNVDIMAISGTEAVQAAARATKTIPIVMTSVGDPVGAGIVPNLAHPGGNVTGMSLLATDLSAKRLALLKEMLPQVTRVAILWNPDNASVALKFEEMQRAAPGIGVQVQSIQLRRAADIEAAIDIAASGHAEAIMDAGDPIQNANQRRIAELSIQHRLPLASEFQDSVDAGALCSYGPDQVDIFRRAAGYVDKILRGAKPGDLPIQQPSKLDLVVNLKTAKILNVTIPERLLLRATRVVE